MNEKNVKPVPVGHWPVPVPANRPPGKRVEDIGWENGGTIFPFRLDGTLCLKTPPSRFPAVTANPPLAPWSIAGQRGIEPGQA